METTSASSATAPSAYLTTVPVGAPAFSNTEAVLLLALFCALFVLSVSKVLPWYLARKALHIGTGTLCIMAQSLGFNKLILAVGLVTLVLITTKCVKIYPMQKYAGGGGSSAEPNGKLSFDIGIFNFTACTMVCVALNISLVHLSPIYYADPMGAIVGKNLRTPKIPFEKKKTWGGSLAVMFSAYAALVFFAQDPHYWALLWGFMISLTEAYSGEWDNAAIAGLLYLRYFLTAP